MNETWGCVCSVWCMNSDISGLRALLLIKSRAFFFWVHSMSTHPDSRLPRHTLFVKGLSTYRGENSTGGIISGETGLAHAGTVIDNKGSNFVFLLVVASYKRENGLVDWIEIWDARSGAMGRRHEKRRSWLGFLPSESRQEERKTRVQRREKKREGMVSNEYGLDILPLKVKELCPWITSSDQKASIHAWTTKQGAKRYM